MRKFALAVLCVFILTQPLIISADYQRILTINLHVECVEAAANAVRAMAGHSISEDVNFNPQGGFAQFTRRVPSGSFAQVQAELRTLGEIISENESITHMDAELTRLQATLTANSQELERLMELMERATTLDMIIAIDARLSDAEWERDNLRGRVNSITEQSASPIMHINFWENPPEPVPLPPDGFGERVTHSFMRSLNGFISFMQGVAVLLAYLSVPLVITGIIGAISYHFYRKNRNRPKPFDTLIIKGSDKEGEA